MPSVTMSSVLLKNLFAMSAEESSARTVFKDSAPDNFKYKPHNFSASHSQPFAARLAPLDDQDFLSISKFRSLCTKIQQNLLGIC